jgi:lysozyme
VNVIDRIKKDEGFSPTVYRCSAGYLTIGYGLNLESGITEFEASRLLESRVRRCERDLIEIFGIDLWDEFGMVRRGALVNMRYQLGPGGFRDFVNMIAALKRHEYRLAQYHALDSKWAREDSPSRAQRIAFEIGDGVAFD